MGVMKKIRRTSRRAEAYTRYAVENMKDSIPYTVTLTTGERVTMLGSEIKAIVKKQSEAAE